MDSLEVTLQGDMIVLDISDGVRTITRALTLDEADELAQNLTDLLIECDLDTCPPERLLDDDDLDEVA